MKRAVILSLVFSLALALMAACTQVTPSTAPLPEDVVETEEEAPAETAPPSPTATEAEAAETELPATEPPTEAPTEAETEATEEAEPVEALITERCSACHDAGRVFRAQKTEAEWEANIDRMIDYGADVSAAEKALMIEWLVSRTP